MKLLDVVARRQGEPALVTHVVEWDRVAGCVGLTHRPGLAVERGGLQRPGHRQGQDQANAVRILALDSYDRISGEFKVREKGDVERTARLSPKVQRHMREYLARRPRKATSGQMWVTERGKPLSYGGGHMVVRRARAGSGISRMHAHLFRHGLAQYAADIGTIQTVLGHKTTAMARPYAWIGKGRD